MILDEMRAEGKSLKLMRADRLLRCFPGQTSYVV